MNQKQIQGRLECKPPRFHPGKVVMTPGALEALASTGELPSAYLVRHVTGDWGDLGSHDVRANERAMKTGERLLSSYKLAEDEPLWVITEAVDGDPRRREITTILLPSEY